MKRRDFLTTTLCGVAIASLLPLDAAASPGEGASAPQRVEAADGAWLSLEPQHHRLRHYSPRGELRWTLGGDPVAGPVNYPVAAAFAPGGELFVVDRGLAALLVLSGEGRVLRRIGQGTLQAPRDLALGADGELYVCDAALHQVLVYSPQGLLRRRIASWGLGEQALNGPHSLALDAGGLLHVADLGNRRVQRYEASTGAWRGSYAEGKATRALRVDQAGRGLWLTERGEGEPSRYAADLHSQARRATIWA